MRLFTALLLCLLVSACSTTMHPSKTQDSGTRTIDYIELFMSRASSSGTEFEQFKITPGGIYMECGEVSRGRPKPETQEFKNTPSDLFPTLSPLVEDIFISSKEFGPLLEKPGKAQSMFDPGIFTLGLGYGNDKLELNTSVNTVANADGILEKKIRRLTQAIRKALGNDDCGKNDFYGIAPTL